MSATGAGFTRRGRATSEPDVRGFLSFVFEKPETTSRTFQTSPRLVLIRRDFTERTET